MPSGRYLLDTNIVIALFAEEPSVKQRVAEAAEVFASIVVLGELYYGARKSTRVESNLRTVDEFAAANRVLGCDTSGDGSSSKHDDRYSFHVHFPAAFREPIPALFPLGSSRTDKKLAKPTARITGTGL